MENWHKEDLNVGDRLLIVANSPKADTVITPPSTPPKDQGSNKSNGEPKKDDEPKRNGA